MESTGNDGSKWTNPETSSAATWTSPLYGAIAHWCSLVHSLRFRIPPPATAKAMTPRILMTAVNPAICHADYQAYIERKPQRKNPQRKSQNKKSIETLERCLPQPWQHTAHKQNRSTKNSSPRDKTESTRVRARIAPPQMTGTSLNHRVLKWFRARLAQAFQYDSAKTKIFDETNKK